MQVLIPDPNLDLEQAISLGGSIPEEMNDGSDDETSNNFTATPAEMAAKMAVSA